jgi:hypothetical protein
VSLLPTAHVPSTATAAGPSHPSLLQLPAAALKAARLTPIASAVKILRDEAKRGQAATVPQDQGLYSQFLMAPPSRRAVAEQLDGSAGDTPHVICVCPPLDHAGCSAVAVALSDGTIWLYDFPV